MGSLTMAEAQAIKSQRKTETQVKEGKMKWLDEVIQDGAWKGKPCFVVGGGASLRGFDFGRLGNAKPEMPYRILGTNYSLRGLKPHMLFFFDPPVWGKMFDGLVGAGAQQRINDTDYIKCTFKYNTPMPDDFVFVRMGNEDGIARSLSEPLSHGGNSGYVALEIAILLQANPIYLLGYDMCADSEGYLHWWDNHKVTKAQVKTYGQFQSKVENLADPARERGIEVYNLSPISKLKNFQFKDVDEVLPPSKKKTAVKVDHEKTEKSKYQKAWKSGEMTKSQCALKFGNFIAKSKCVPKTDKILDIGCGDGTTIKALRKAGFKNTYGVDITLQGLSGVKKNMFEAPAWKLPFKDGEFDMVVSTDLLEHLPPEKLEDTLKEISRVTNPKGFNLHVIATFEDRGFHLIVKDINWWHEVIDKHIYQKKQIMSRDQFLKMKE